LFAFFLGLKIIPGTNYPIIDVKDAKKFAEEHGLPIIFKAAHGKSTLLK